MKPITNRIAAFLLTLGLATSAFAGNGNEGGGEGHGGKVWICKQGDGSETIELVDFQRARDRWSLTIDLPGENADTKVKAALDRLEKVDPYRASVYKKSYSNFYERSLMLSDFDLHDLRDTFEVGTFKNCEYKVVINQAPAMKLFSLDKSKRFFIAKSIFDKLDETTKAGLILHEIAYEEAINRGAKSSDTSMYLNANISSSEMNSMNETIWATRLLESGFSYFIPFKSGALGRNVTRYPDGTIRNATVGAPYLESGIEINKLRELEYDSAKSEYIPQFYKNGVTITGYTAGHTHTLPDGQKLQFRGHVHFYPSGKVSFAALSNYQIIRHPDLGKFVINGTAYFHENGQLKMVEATSKVSINIKNNGTANAQGPIYFQEDGSLDQFQIITPITVKYGLGSITLSGSTLLNNDHELIYSTAHTKTKVRFSEKRKPVAIAAGQIVIFSADNAVEIDNAIVSNNSAETHFIRVIDSGIAISFKYCMIDDPNNCEQIGNAEYISKKKIRRELRMTQLVSEADKKAVLTNAKFRAGTGIAIGIAGLALAPVSLGASVGTFFTGTALGVAYLSALDESDLNAPLLRNMAGRISARNITKGSHIVVYNGSMDKLREQLAINLDVISK